MPWVHMASANLTVSGVDTSGTRFGKPAYIHFILAGVIVVLTFIKRIWAKRFNLLFAALNLAWAFKNFVVISKCDGGECPERQTGLYLALAASITLLITTFFPNMKIPATEPDGVTEDEVDN